MSSAPGRKIELVHWVPHGTWSWTLDADSCSICRNSLMSMCIECTASPKDDFTKQSCSVTWGECGHAFHTHCISKWLKQRNSCPIDNADWTVKQVSSAISG